MASQESFLDLAEFDAKTRLSKSACFTFHSCCYCRQSSLSFPLGFVDLFSKFVNRFFPLHLSSDTLIWKHTARCPRYPFIICCGEKRKVEQVGVAQHITERTWYNFHFLLSFETISRTTARTFHAELTLCINSTEYRSWKRDAIFFHLTSQIILLQWMSKCDCES